MPQLNRDLCKHCYQLLDPNDEVVEKQELVQCVSCGTAYHQICIQEMTPDTCYTCGNNTYEQIDDFVAPLPIQVVTREAILPQTLIEYEQQQRQRRRVAIMSIAAIAVLMLFFASAQAIMMVKDYLDEQRVIALENTRVVNSSATAFERAFIATADAQSTEQQQTEAVFQTATEAELRRILILTFTATPSNTPTSTNTPTPTSTSTATWTPTLTSTSTNTPTATPNIALTNAANDRATRIARSTQQANNLLLTETALRETQTALETAPSNRQRVPSGAVQLDNGQGLTDGRTMSDGEFQVEGYCRLSNTNVFEDGQDWFCGGRALSVADFDQICNLTYNVTYAFALQTANNGAPAYNWVCYAYQENIDRVRRLEVNGTAIVFSSNSGGINVRSNPSVNASVITSVQPGELVTILDGPQEGSGYTWWEIRLSSGTVGWIVEEINGFQILRP